MKYTYALVGAFTLVVNCYQPAQAQQELTVLRSASINQGAQRRVQLSYQHAIKYSREAVMAAGFVIELAERIEGETYLILGKKTVAGDLYGEVVRVLTNPRKRIDLPGTRTYPKESHPRRFSRDQSV